MSRPLTGRRKCRFCNMFFVPDPRTKERQRYCSKAECRRASKLSSQCLYVGLTPLRSLDPQTLAD